ncbi:MAG TPA: peptidase [Alphaproteobacteria bacterium]|nr:peptidase [Alphaproteobacteria bacterium]
MAVASDDHELAREALTSGQIRPLGEIVNSVQSRCRGKVIEVELERTSREGGDLWLYQLRMMMPKGDILRLDVDAATTQILKVKGQGALDACHAGS